MAAAPASGGVVSMVTMLRFAGMAVFILSFAEAQQAQTQREGSVCYNKDTKTPGVCRRMLHCRWATEEVASQDPGRGRPQICAFRGYEPLVCCPTSVESIVFPNSGFLTGAISTTNNNVIPPPPAPPAGSPGGPPAGSRPPTPAPPRPSLPPRPRPPNASNGRPGDMARRKCVEYERYAPTARYGVDKDCIPNHTYPIGGNPAIAREFTHMALLGYGPRDNIVYRCGGSLISMVWVMTAAHCLFVGETPVSWVMMGELDRSRDDEDSFEQLIPVAERVGHPDFRQPAYYNDIALIRLQWSPNMTTGHVRPACLQVDKQLAKEKVYLTGWGFTKQDGDPAKELMEVALYRTRHEDCAERYGTNRLTMPRGVDEETQLCAGADQLLKDACNGDSGGPLQSPVIKETCMYNLAGVVSLGLGCGVGAPGIYTRVSHYTPWIENIVWPDP